MSDSFDDKIAEFTDREAFFKALSSEESSEKRYKMMSEHSDKHRYVESDARAYRMLQALADKNGLVMPTVEEIYGTNLQYVPTSH